MKTIDSLAVLTDVLKIQSSCTISDLADYKVKKEREDKENYVDVTRKSILSAVRNNPNMFYWDSERNVIHKQETIKCPFCEIEHRMFPDVQKFIKAKETLERIKNKL